MTCSRCGAEAAVKRDNAFYCAKCAMARDWEEVIAIVQEERVNMAASVDFSASGADAVRNGAARNAPAAAPPAPAPAAVPAAPAPTVAPEGNGGLPADPFS